MRKLSAIVAGLALCVSAHADELVLNLHGQQTLWDGTVSAVHTDGMTGEVVLLDASAPSVSGNPVATPPVTGLWHVTIHGPGKPTEFFGQCYAKVDTADFCGTRVELTCVDAEVHRAAR